MRRWDRTTKSPPEASIYLGHDDDEDVHIAVPATRTSSPGKRLARRERARRGGMGSKFGASFRVIHHQKLATGRGSPRPQHIDTG